MAQVKRNSEWDAGLSAPMPVERAGAMAVPSPARALQQLLEERAGVSADELRWSRRRALTFIVASAASLWLALLAAAHGTMAAIA